MRYLRILLVEDESDAARMIAKGLRQEGYAVDLAGDGEEGLEKARTHLYDSIIMDVRMPGKDGWTMCREIRESGLTVPLMFLTARSLPADRIKGLDLGADDYLVKPFEMAELFARLRALLRRKPVLFESVIRIDTLEVHLQSRTVQRSGKFVRLTTKEYALLECLARNARSMMGREAISECVWDETYDPFSNVIEEYIKRLRKKIDGEGEKPLIHSRRGEGYILTDEEFG